MFYLWEDKKSNEYKKVLYITDYKELRKDGKARIDPYGYIDVDLIFCSKKKQDCIQFAQNKL